MSHSERSSIIYDAARLCW